jgi:hypothetical protein
VSYEVLPPLKICGIAWELRCLNESSVARHQPELWARGIHMEGYFVHLFLCCTSWCYNYRSIWPFQASGPSRGPRGMSSCLIAPCPIQIGWIWTCFSPFFRFYHFLHLVIQTTSRHFKLLQAISSHFKPPVNYSGFWRWRSKSLCFYRNKLHVYC